MSQMPLTKCDYMIKAVAVVNSVRLACGSERERQDCLWCDRAEP
jgi:hypothetical protein